MGFGLFGEFGGLIGFGELLFGFGGYRASWFSGFYLGFAFRVGLL